MSDTPLYDITPFTALDYPEHLAAILWFARCNMRCPYCYNKDIVQGEGSISEAEALRFLESRVELLEGVVLSGGEATFYSDLAELCVKIKHLGFKIKLDTNGLNPEMVQNLTEQKLVDYIALDYKAPKERYFAVTKDQHFDRFVETLSYLIQKNFPFEVRTTVHSDLLGVMEINRIINDLVKRGYRSTYYLQPFVYTDSLIGRVKPEQNPFDRSQLSDALEVVWRE